MAIASSLAYGLLVDLQYYDVIRPLNPFPLPEVHEGKLMLQLLFNLVAFYAVALLSGYLAEELRRAGERLEVVEAEVLDLEHLRDSILQSLGSGLVALDTRNRELFHNRAAEELLARAGVALGGTGELSRHFTLEPGERHEVTFPEHGVVLGYGVSPLFDRQGTPRGNILICQDLTQVKRLEEELRRSDRLAAVGRLAAGLAHEIPNPLASLSGSAEVLRQGAVPGGDDARLLEIVLRETERLNRLVTNFLHYARPGAGERVPVALHDLVEQVAFFFRQARGRETFTLDNRVPESLSLRADPAQVEQLLLNLFRNSVEAAPGGLRVTVTAAEGPQGIKVSVGDDGPGVPAAVAERIFEPFFTAKEGGTGLGLATVHRIMENHGGSVRLADGATKGATFELLFPGS
ncbi:MAG: hypothetical protein IH608_07030 [Proteobacteria bacterium]|nr:hypothetical protein [Pseudomonadota bacterium]